MTLPLTKLDRYSLVWARGQLCVLERDWAPNQYAYLRTLSFGQGETIRLAPSDPAAKNLRPATFPDPGQGLPEAVDAAAPYVGGQSEAWLLRTSMRFSGAHGPGPFRSFAALSFTPFSYQLVPLLLALRQEPVRLLLADEVGTGKTRQAGLIARELRDRGTITSFAVLCPPHLVSQWAGELRGAFAFERVQEVDAENTEDVRGRPIGCSSFDGDTVSVVSLDYIKRPERRESFCRACPELLIVDEAHLCSSTQRSQQRYALLRDLIAPRMDKGGRSRHLVLLSAAPHNGKSSAFDRLVELVADDNARGHHIVHRRRVDVADGQELRFPKTVRRTVLYEFTSVDSRLWGQLRQVSGACLEGPPDAPVLRLGKGQDLGLLTLMAAAASSPAAFQAALVGSGEDAKAPATAGKVARGTSLSEGGPKTGSVADAEEGGEDTIGHGRAAVRRLPASVRADLVALGQQGCQDPETHGKLRTLLEVIERLCGVAATIQGFRRPVIFCRFVATAEWVATHLAARLPQVRVGCVTGAVALKRRQRKIEDLAHAPGPYVLVATDCLSEGMNLQQWFDVVVHYDLTWEPLRLEQRLGRVDRIGQARPQVDSIALVCEAALFDRALMANWRGKAAEIRRSLGQDIWVPLAGENKKVSKQTPPEAAPNFSQSAIDPSQCSREYEKTERSFGSPTVLTQFLHRALTLWGCAVQQLPSGGLEIDPRPGNVPRGVGEALSRLGEHCRGPIVKISCQVVVEEGALSIGRRHDLVEQISLALRVSSLPRVSRQERGRHALPRLGCWETTHPAVVQTCDLVLVRLRHYLLGRGLNGEGVVSPGRASLAVHGARGCVEQTTALLWSVAAASPVARGDAALEIFEAPQRPGLAAGLRVARVRAAITRCAQRERQREIEAWAQVCGRELEAEHMSVLDEHHNLSAGALKVVTLSAEPVGIYHLFPSELAKGAQ